MKPETPTVPLALWLDPDSSADQAAAHALRSAGWQVDALASVEDWLGRADEADALVLRPSADALRSLANHLHAPTQTTVPAARPAVRQVVFVDPASQHLLAMAQKVAQADVTALLVGPTGSGKEVMARVLHDASPRMRGPFVALNCAAMPEQLIEDMLFGHEKGAFTGAHREHKGLFEQAQGGTLFLDEIGEMPMHLQSKLLRVLQERQLTRLGGTTPISVDARIIAATNKDLRQAITEREFREDLYYRIATFRMRLLPLCERRGDIVPLALHALGQHAPRGQAWQLHPQAQTMLLDYPWPGNVRELENVIKRAVVLCPDHCILPSHLMFDDWIEAAPSLSAAPALANDPPAPMVSLPIEHTVTPLPAGQGLNSQTMGTDLQSASRMSEHQMIMATLAVTPSKTEAARQLGISPRTLRYKLAQFRELGMHFSHAS